MIKGQQLIGRRPVMAAIIAVVVVICAAGIVAAANRGGTPAAEPSPVAGAATLNQLPPDPSTTSPRPSASAAAAAAKAKAKAKKVAAKAKQKAKASSNGTASSSTSGSGGIRSGPTRTGVATFYGATGAGNCSFEASSDLMVGAMNQQDYENSQACGAFLAVTGPNGKTIRIRIVDRCPECPPGAIDLSQQAFTKLAPASAGRIQISWRLVSPALSGPVAYKYKTGSSQNWCGIQVRNHRNPVRSMQLKIGGTFKTLDRQEYNYFLSESGAGCGGTIRITDIFGNQVTDTGIKVRPDAVQAGHAQFGPPQ